VSLPIFKLKKPVLIVLVGPTSVGKTAISIELAKHLDSVILSSDSRQFYKEMVIGTAKPSLKQLKEVEHYFVNNLSIHEYFSVGDFEQNVLNFLDVYFQKNHIAILVGGSGLYVDAVLSGLDDLPIVPEELRWTIMKEVEENGLSTLVAELQNFDPIYAQLVDLKNKQRIVRAVEVIRYTKKPFSSFMKKSSQKRPFEVIKIGITSERNSLYKSINFRVDEMMKQGLLEEARKLHEYKNLYALQTVGYKELFDHLEGKLTLHEAIELIKRNTRRYAKRQLTWFRKDAEITWFENTELENIKNHVSNKLILRT